MKKWYAVMKDREDQDWVYGSEKLDEAKRMVKEMESDEAYIAVIDITDDDPMCVAEIEQDEF